MYNSASTKLYKYDLIDVWNRVIKYKHRIKVFESYFIVIYVSYSTTLNISILVSLERVLLKSTYITWVWSAVASYTLSGSDVVVSIRTWSCALWDLRLCNSRIPTFWF